MKTQQSCLLFSFTDSPTTEIYPLSLHDALPIFEAVERRLAGIEKHEHGAELEAGVDPGRVHSGLKLGTVLDRKSTRLNSSHSSISYAVFCLKKKTILSSVTSGLRMNKANLTHPS